MSEPGAPAVVAAPRPIARVLPLLEPAHLDRDFDYLVPPEFDADAQPGVRVRVRFSGRLIDGYVLERLEKTSHTGKLVRLDRVVSPEKVLTPEILRLVTAVAARYAGTRADVLRLAIPPRHAKVEAEGATPKPATPKKRRGKAAAAKAVAAEPAPIDLDDPADPIPDSAPDQHDALPETAPAAVESSPDTGITEQPTTAVALEELSPAASAPDVVEGDAEPAPGLAEAVAGQEVSELYPDWGRYAHGHSFLGAVAAGRGPRAAWQALPGEDWARRLAELAATTVGSGRSAILMVPDQRDLDRVLTECVALVGESAVGLAAGLGPSARYRRWLAALRGTARVVVGTRSSVFAPVKDLGLIAIWDDGDDTYAEPRSPYPHAREVAMLRAHETGAAFVAAGFARTAEVQAIVESGWAHDLLAERSLLRQVMPRLIAPGDTDAALERDPMARAIRIPAAAFMAARRALAAGEPVLVQVPRRGYIPALSCSKCRTPARCRHCNGPLALPDNNIRASTAGKATTARGTAAASDAGRGAGRGTTSDQRGASPAGRGRAASQGPSGAQGRGPQQSGEYEQQGLNFENDWGAPGPGAQGRDGGARTRGSGGRGNTTAWAQTDDRGASGAWSDPGDRGVSGGRAAASGWGDPGDRGSSGGRTDAGDRAAAGGWGNPGRDGGGRGYGTGAQARGARDRVDLGVAVGVGTPRGGSEVAHSPACRWCGITEAAFRCGACGSRALRAVVIGAARTAEELGRAFPGVPVRGSGGSTVLSSVPEGPQVVVSTIGAEPSVPGGYSVAMLLDGWALLGREDLRAAEDAMRRWMSAAALVRSGGQVIVMADPALATVQAFLRWDPVGHAQFELGERIDVRFPPAVRLAAIDGTADSIAELLAEAKLPDVVEVLGPVPLPPGARKPFSSGDSPAEVERMILRVDRSAGSSLSKALSIAQAVRSTHKSDDPLRVQIDPVDIG
ncbi:primosomal protein N' [Nocardia sp. NPDC056000]|uniref:primosomal protein N' family DNA-binding protein n=1 Tax=Nocardia sp. NPDC056000 TaxID=3345674 RepID=UPI0035DCDEBE